MRRPEVVDSFEIIDELGHGGMATVYRARDMHLEREVALKILHDHIASSEDNRERFAREARAVARLNHPNIIRIYGYSSPDDQLGYIAAELIEGPTLRQFYTPSLREFPEIGVMLVAIVARALQAAHDARILHRDLKPENIMIDGEGKPRLMDFGLARLMDAQTMTMTGSLLGSPAHMAPEIIEGEDYDERVDIFALGTILYYLCSGALPFDGQNPAVVLHRVTRGEYRALSSMNPLVVRPLENIVHRAMAHRPDDRHASAQELAEELESYLASIGIEDPAVEFSRYFQDQSGWLHRAEGWLVDAMIARASDLAMQGPPGYPEALAWTDRVLQTTPEHEGALALLAALTRDDKRRKLKRAGALILLAILTFSLIFGAGMYLQRRAESRAADAALAEASVRLNEAALRAGRNAAAYDANARAIQLADATLRRARLSAEEVRLARVAPGLVVARRAVDQARIVADDEATRRARQRSGTRDVAQPPTSDDEDRVAESEETPVASYEVTFLVQPPAAVLLVDGEERCRGGTRCRITLSAGEHSVVARHPGTEMEIRDTVTVRGEGSTHRYRVPWRPATLYVESDRSGIVIFNGQRIGATNRAIEVPIEGLRSNVEGTLRVIPDGSFGTPVDRTISLSSGEVRRENVRF